jgi:hypothetical protein
MRLHPSYFTNYAVRHLGNNIWELASPADDGFAKPRMHRAITPAFPRISKPIKFFLGINMFDPSDSVKLRNREKKRRSRSLHKRGLVCVRGLWVDEEKVHATIRRRQHLPPDAKVSDKLMTDVLAEAIAWWSTNWLSGRQR